MKKRYTKTERISSTKAQKLLSSMRRNRPVRRRLVEKHVKAMLKGEWRGTSQGISIDWDGHLMNGQHRLLAVVESGVTVEMDVTYNEDPANFKILDKGRTRTVADDLHIEDVQYPKESSRIYRLWLDFQSVKPDRYVALGRISKFGWNSEEAIAWVRKNEDTLAHIIERCRRKDAKYALRPPSLWMTLYFLFYEVDSEDADAFMEKFIGGCDGAGPVPKLREAMDKVLLEKVRGAVVPPYLYAALIIKGWNAYRAGKRPKIISFEARESFPAISE